LLLVIPSVLELMLTTSLTSRVPLSLNLGVGLENVVDRLVHVNKETAVLKGTPLVSLTMIATSWSHDTYSTTSHDSSVLTCFF